MAKISREKFKVYEGVFDQYTIDSLAILKNKGYFDELKNPIKTGKEGDVYLAKKGEEFLAIKIYRLTSANFKKISEYISRDYRFRNIRGNLRKVILRWVEKEYRNLFICHKNHMNVPMPYKQYNNIIIMDYIEGDMLKDSVLTNPKKTFDMIVDQLDIMKNHAKLIHGDLSEFNILVKEDIPYLIDFGQGMTIKNEDDFKTFYDLYERDIRNVVNYFNRKHKLDIKFEDVIERLDNKEEE